MKLLYFGDRHNRVDVPLNRMDDYRASMLKKDNEILDIAHREKVSYLLEPGDFWDTPNPPLDFATNVIKRWFNVDVFSILSNLLSKKATTEDYTNIKNQLSGFIPMVGVVGNHELFGNNINTLDKTMIGFMNNIGLINLVTKDNPLILKTDDGLTIAITGSNYHIDLDTPSHTEDYIVRKKLGDIHIHLAHGMLTDKTMGKMIKHTTLDKVAYETVADLTITGDDHIGYPLTKIDGKYFVNTGAIPRQTSDKKEVARQPKVLLIDITKANGLVLKEVHLKSAIDGKIVLNTETNKAKKSRVRKSAELKAIAEKATNKSSMNIFEIIASLSDRKNIKENLKKDLLNRLSAKKEAIDDYVDINDEQIYVSKIILENFLSHKYTEITPSKGLNIFAGESRCGKTSVIRGLRWIVKNELNRKHLLRRGAEYVRATVELSNGYKITRHSDDPDSDKTNKRNGYYIFDPNTGEEEYYNTKILPQVQELLGFNLWKVDEDKNNHIDLNFSNQGEKWFLIGESDPLKAKIIGAIYGTNYADGVLRDVIKERKQVHKSINKTITELGELDVKIKELDYLDELEIQIKETEETILKIEELTKQKQAIERLILERTPIQSKINETIDMLKITNHLIETYPLSLELNTLVSKNRDMHALYLSNIKLNKYLKYSNTVLNWTMQIDEASDLYSILKSKNTKHTNLLALSKSHLELELQVKQANESLITFKDAENASNKLIDLKKLQSQHSEISKILKELSYANKVMKGIDKVNVITSKINTASTMLIELKTIIDKSVNISKYVQDRSQIQRYVAFANETIEQTKHVEIAEMNIVEMRESLKKLNDIKTLISNRQKIEKDILKASEIVKTEDEKLEALTVCYKNALEEAGKCPICFGTIDKAIVNRIIHELNNTEEEAF